MTLTGKDIAMELLRGRILYRLGYWRLADPALVKYLVIHIECIKPDRLLSPTCRVIHYISYQV